MDLDKRIGDHAGVLAELDDGGEVRNGRGAWVALEEVNRGRYTVVIARILIARAELVKLLYHVVDSYMLLIFELEPHRAERQIS